MRLVVKQSNRTVNELKFLKGPVYIGRNPDSQVFLPNVAVSKQHAVIFNTPEGKWVVEDMNSANKTYLNDQPVDQAEIRTGNILHITDFDIEIDLEDFAKDDKSLHLEAALTTPPHEIVVRKPDAGHAPAMRLPAKRATDFSEATEAISKAESLDELLQALLNIILKQFAASHTWCALRNQPTGPMTHHAGKRRDGQSVELNEIKLNDKITQVVEKGQFLVLPRVSAQIEEEERIRSAMIAAVMTSAGCFGVLYLDNSMHDTHYSLSDLDYLIILSIHIAAVMKKL